MKHVRRLEAQDGVPVVFYGVVGAAEEEIGDVGPAIFEDLAEEVEYPVLLCRPKSCFLKQWVELIEPTLATLLPCALWHEVCYSIPLVWSNLGN